MGYKFYVGTSSGVYGASIKVGNPTDYEVRNLEPGRTYYFSVVVYDSFLGPDHPAGFAKRRWHSIGSISYG